MEKVVRQVNVFFVSPSCDGFSGNIQYLSSSEGNHIWVITTFVFDKANYYKDEAFGLVAYICFFFFFLLFCHFFAFSHCKWRRIQLFRGAEHGSRLDWASLGILNGIIIHSCPGALAVPEHVGCLEKVRLVFPITYS